MKRGRKREFAILSDAPLFSSSIPFFCLFSAFGAPPSFSFSFERLGTNKSIW